MSSLTIDVSRANGRVILHVGSNTHGHFDLRSGAELQRIGVHPSEVSEISGRGAVRLSEWVDWPRLERVRCGLVLTPSNGEAGEQRPATRLNPFPALKEVTESLLASPWVEYPLLHTVGGNLWIEPGTTLLPALKVVGDGIYVEGLMRAPRLVCVGLDIRCNADVYEKPTNFQDSVPALAVIGRSMKLFDRDAQLVGVRQQVGRKAAIAYAEAIMAAGEVIRRVQDESELEDACIDDFSAGAGSSLSL